MNKVISFTASFCVLLCIDLGMARAAEHHIEYETDTETYTVWFDDTRISVAEMQRLVWLSPNLPPDLPGPFLMVSSYRDDKCFVVPKLEDCSSNSRACGDVTDAVFLQNAELNLHRGTEQIERLKKGRVPTTLQPVRAYLVQDMELYWNLEQACYLYAQKGSTKMFRQILCEQCGCDAASEPSR